MNFTFDNELESFISTINDFIQKDYTPQHIRNAWSSGDPFSNEHWKSMINLGVSQMILDEKFQGMGLSLDEAILVYEELAYGGVIEPIIEQSILINNLAHEFPQGLQDLIGERLIDQYVALTHPSSPFVNHLSHASGILSIQNNDISFVELEGIESESLESNDPSRVVSSIKSIKNSHSFKLDPSLERKIVSSGKLVSALTIIGLSRRCLDISSEYVKTREQFGKPIGSFQAVKHMLSDIAVKIEFAKAAIYRAANSIISDHPLHELHSNVAKYLANQAGEIATKNSIQAHGAMGYTWEVDLHIFMRRIWAFNSLWATQSEIEFEIESFLHENTEKLGATFTFTED
jgi:alkylation response protein AidB-like acyl-CoA dehydrogenase